MQRCGNEVLMHRASRMSIEATTIEFGLSLFILSTNLMLNRDKRKKKKKEKREKM
jgi:small neutral amino acid transporter SnatA (MarC family)